MHTGMGMDMVKNMVMGMDMDTGMEGDQAV